MGKFLNPESCSKRPDYSVEVQWERNAARKASDIERSISDQAISIPPHAVVPDAFEAGIRARGDLT